MDSISGLLCKNRQCNDVFNVKIVNAENIITFAL